MEVPTMIKLISLKIKFLLLSVLLSFPLLSEETDIVFRKNAFQDHGISKIGKVNDRSKFSLDVTVETDNRSGKYKILAPSITSTMGGVLFLEVAEPRTDALKCPTIKFNPLSANGNRLEFVFEKEKALGGLYDWEITPIVNFVKSGKHGLFSFMGYYAQYHPDFNDSLVGLNLFFLDNFRKLTPQKAASIHMDIISSEIPGYTSETVNGQPNAADNLIKKLDYYQLYFTDEGVKYSFYISDDKLVIDGHPYWMRITTDGDGNGKEIDRVDDEDLMLNANPVIFGSGIRIAKYIAVFRYLKGSCRNQWNSLLDNLKENEKSIDGVRVPISEMPVYM